MHKLSIILPAKNEAEGLKSFLPRLRKQQPHAEIIVVNDGSTDNTAEICLANGVFIVTHPYSMGNGAAIKSGVRHATGDVLVFMDADGQHQPEDIPRLLAHIDNGYDMAVGARDGDSQASKARGFGNALYNRLASYMTGHEIKDLTSGFRAAKTHKFREFLHLLPNGFSYPTTCTMAFFRSGYSVIYEPITAPKRIGNSHLNVMKDGFRFLLIIFKIGTLHSPLKLFLPISLSFFFTGLAYYLYTLTSVGRFTNMSALLFSTSTIIFLIGLVSEQITSLIYNQAHEVQPLTGGSAFAPEFSNHINPTALSKQVA
ncbi:glycosyltransferase family 2 protein [uncultured Thiothrix sp.]|jgi:glycosyltransferase involved in cell wall biosynthesis|uniref:glycosyltransferase family 2 protein n=1 Tax=uncultured Thiothrix sp. TaxID=223185 RepID=UPI002602FC28|nr:glycosyltransferase family 2 protein [uncultured Thiothrix sp.]HMT92617.1 glycosyltransferase family 2 protein [Thiolinea sp.]